MTRGFNDTTLGMLKAMHNIAAQDQKRAAPPKHPRYSYQQVGTVVHAKRFLSAIERAIVDGILSQLHRLDPAVDGDRIQDLLTSLNKTGFVHFVPIKQATKIDYSKRYPYRSAKRSGMRMAA